MREILFRGKRVDKGEWTEGYLFKQWNRTFLLWGMTGDIPNMTEVISQTAGQFTGMTDKNGKKIFEGDIIRAITLDTGSEEIAVVCFGNFIDENNDDEYIGFYIEFDGIKTTATQLAMEECKNRIEIIGNIFDNPELLYVEEGSTKI